MIEICSSSVNIPHSLTERWLSPEILKNWNMTRSTNNHDRSCTAKTYFSSAFRYSYCIKKIIRSRILLGQMPSWSYIILTVGSDWNRAGILQTIWYDRFHAIQWTTHSNYVLERSACIYHDGVPRPCHHQLAVAETLVCFPFIFKKNGPLNNKEHWRWQAPIHPGETSRHNCCTVFISPAPCWRCLGRIWVLVAQTRAFEPTILPMHHQNIIFH